jgi:hypothetical protein
MPALVQAAGESDPDVRTLVLTPEAAHSVRAELVTGSGSRLDRIRSSLASPEETAADRDLAEVVGGLASVGGPDMRERLQDEGIGFVLLVNGGSDLERAELQRVFDQHASLASAGLTEQGLLWRVADPESVSDAQGDAGTRLGGTSLTGQTIWGIQLVVLLGMVLLALPTGEVTYRPERRKRPSRRAVKRAGTSAPAAPGTAAGAAPVLPGAPGAPTEAPSEAAPSDPDPGARHGSEDTASAARWLPASEHPDPEHPAPERPRAGHPAPEADSPEHPENGGPR